MMVFGLNRIHAGVQPLNIQRMPSVLNECEMMPLIEVEPEAFIICGKEARKGGTRRWKKR
jgi:hypothetical protein